MTEKELESFHIRQAISVTKRIGDFDLADIEQKCVNALVNGSIDKVMCENCFMHLFFSDEHDSDGHDSTAMECERIGALTTAKKYLEQFSEEELLEILL